MVRGAGSPRGADQLEQPALGLGARQARLLVRGQRRAQRRAPRGVPLELHAGRQAAALRLLDEPLERDGGERGGQVRDRPRRGRDPQPVVGRVVLGRQPSHAVQPQPGAGADSRGDDEVDRRTGLDLSKLPLRGGGEVAHDGAIPTAQQRGHLARTGTGDRAGLEDPATLR